MVNITESIKFFCIPTNSFNTLSYMYHQLTIILDANKTTFKMVGNIDDIALI